MRISFTITVLLFFCANTLQAQWLKGNVKNESGSAASAVTVEFLNKENKISTNADGSFKIFAPNLPDTLVFTSPGHEPYKVIVTEKNIKDPNFEVVLLSKRTRKFEHDSESLALTSADASAPMRDVVVTSSVGSRSYHTKSKVGGALAGKVSGVSLASGSGSAASSKKLVSRDSTRRANSLTAGEVNDFTKWKMWEDLTEKEFSDLSRLWAIAAKHRYSVQLTDKNHKPVNGEKVFLINKRNGDTAWRAVSDNTGKAELWADLNTGTAQNEYRLSTANGGGTLKPSSFLNGINHLSINKSCSQNDIVDIAFVVDATGSMDDEIEFLKLELEEVLQKTADKYTNLELRYGSVFYKDNGDDYVTRKVDFQSDMLKVLNFIKLQKSGGGGDFPEAVDSALSVALNNLSWSKEARAKILFLVLDAPPHIEAKGKILKLIERAATIGVRIIPIACSGTDKSTEFLLRSMALGTNGTYSFLTNHSGIGGNKMEPSTDSYNVELLSALMQRLLSQYLYQSPCGNEDISKIPVGITDSVAGVKLFPNPTSGRFTIESKANIKEIYITDFTGKILMKLNGQSQQGRWSVNISSYPSGVYLVKYITTTNKVGTEKVVLMR